MSGYCFKEHQGLKAIRFDMLHNTGLVEHAFTTRQGGFSTGPFYSLNMAFKVGDQTEAVRKNRTKACAALSFDLEEMVCGQQVHDVGVHLVTRGDRGRGSLCYESGIPNTDALITNEPGVLLASFYADCVPVFLVDPVHGAVGLVHAGWKGSVARIGEAALQAMSKAFHTRPGDCLAVIGPSIGACCYEVDEPILEAMGKQGFDPDRYVKPSGKERWKLDLPAMNLDVLMDVGVNRKAVTLSGLCTACNQELFFSYRGEKGNCGRMASLIGLKHSGLKGRNCFVQDTGGG